MMQRQHVFIDYVYMHNKGSEAQSNQVTDIIPFRLYGLTNLYRVNMMTSIGP